MVRLPRISQAGLVDLVCLVYLVGLVQPNKQGNPINESDQTADSVTIIIPLWFQPTVEL